VAVHSMNTFFVISVIAECAPLIIGGNDKTVLQPKKNYPMIKKKDKVQKCYK